MFAVAYKKFSVTLCLIVTVALAAASFILPQNAQALSWTQITNNGFGDTNNSTIVDMLEFNNQIYASVGNGVSGVRIYRSANGTDWNVVNTDGFGNPLFSQVRLAVNGSELYATVAETTAPAPFQVWKTSNGTTWTQVGTDGFGDILNFFGTGIFAWGGNIYVGTWNPATGTEVWQVTPAGAVIQVNSDGFGDPANTQIMEFANYGGYLYAGADNAVTGTQIWRTNDGTTWTQVGISGFGDVANQRVSSFFNFGGYLYAGTININGTQLWRTTNGTDWTVVDNTGFGDAHNVWTGPNAAVVNGVAYLGLRNAVDGARLIYSTDGITWNQEGTDGFGGGIDNFAFYALTYNGFLYLGVSNNGVAGAEIWRTGDINPLSIRTESLPDGTKDCEYSKTLETWNGTTPFVWSVSGDLPRGLTLNTSEGKISGTPTRTGEFTFTISVADSGTPQQLASKTYTLKVNDAVLPETGINRYQLSYWLN